MRMQVIFCQAHFRHLNMTHFCTGGEITTIFCRSFLLFLMKRNRTPSCFPASSSPTSALPVMTVLPDPTYSQTDQAESNILRRENTAPLENVILCCHLEQIIYELKVFFIVYLRKNINLHVRKHFRENFISAAY